MNMRPSLPLFRVTPRASRMLRMPTIIVCGTLLASCMTAPEKVATLSQPKTPVAKTVTNFSQAKACMDQLFLDMGRSGIQITADTINDSTQSVSVSTNDMVITSLSDMSLRSGAFNFFTLEQKGGVIATLQDSFAPLVKLDQRHLPNVYIRGSISQSDNNIATDGQGGSITLPFASLGTGENQSSGTISIDLQIAEVASRQILRGMTTSNTITIVSNSDSQSARGLISNGSFGAGISVSLDSNRREGRSQAVRTLMEYSMIELIGKYTHVPYHRCLELPSTDPRVMQAAQQKYDELDAKSRTMAVQTALSSIGEYAGPVNGLMSPELQAAVSRAKAARNLVANGRIDFQLFNALYNENLLPTSLVAADPVDPATTLSPAEGPTQTAGQDQLGLDLSLVNSALNVGDNVQVRVALARDAQLYCYYQYIQDGAYQTARIFPNNGQINNRLRAGQAMTIPSNGSQFAIQLSGTDEEAIACVATTADYQGRNRPSIIDQEALTPLNCGYAGIGCPLYQHQQADTLNTSAKTLYFRAAR